MMEIQKLRAMKLNELSDELFKLNKELFEMNIKKSTG